MKNNNFTKILLLVLIDILLFILFYNIVQLNNAIRFFIHESALSSNIKIPDSLIIPSGLLILGIIFSLIILTTTVITLIVFDKKGTTEKPIEIASDSDFQS